MLLRGRVEKALSRPAQMPAGGTAERCPEHSEDRAPLLPTTLPDLPGSSRCSQHGGTYGSYKGWDHLCRQPRSSVHRGAAGGTVAVAPRGCPGVRSPSLRWVLPGCGVWGEGSSPRWGPPAAESKGKLFSRCKTNM